MIKLRKCHVTKCAILSHFVYVQKLCKCDSPVNIYACSEKVYACLSVLVGIFIFYNYILSFKSYFWNVFIFLLIMIDLRQDQFLLEQPLD
jgi:hypothetical protein